MKYFLLGILLCSCFTSFSQTDAGDSLAGKTGGLNAQRISFNCSSRNQCLNVNCKPMLLVDSKIVRLAQLASLNPNEILSITILKGNKASSLYGTGAKDGAIVITTKCKLPDTPSL